MGAMEEIEAQQEELNAMQPAWCVGEQLKEMIRQHPGAAAILAEELETKTLTEAEKR